MIDPWPKAMPLGLIRNTRPLEVLMGLSGTSVAWEGGVRGRAGVFGVVRRFTGGVEGCCGMRGVTSFGGRQNWFGWMVPAGVLVAVRKLRMGRGRFCTHVRF